MNILQKIPTWLSSKISIFIFLVLFFYLVIFAILCTLVPSINDYAPTSDTQLLLGNYSNVLSALGAALAAGSGVAIHSSVKKLHENHRQMQAHIDALHKKIDRLGGGDEK